MTYTVLIEHDPATGVYGASTPDLDDEVLGVGASEEEAVERFRNALAGYLAFKRERGEALPPSRYTARTIAV